MIKEFSAKEFVEMTPEAIQEAMLKIRRGFCENDRCIPSAENPGTPLAIIKIVDAQRTLLESMYCNHFIQKGDGLCNAPSVFFMDKRGLEEGTYLCTKNMFQDKNFIANNTEGKPSIDAIKCVQDKIRRMIEG